MELDDHSLVLVCNNKTENGVQCNGTYKAGDEHCSICGAKRKKDEDASSHKEVQVMEPVDSSIVLVCNSRKENGDQCNGQYTTGENKCSICGGERKKDDDENSHEEVQVMEPVDSSIVLVCNSRNENGDQCSGQDTTGENKCSICGVVRKKDDADVEDCEDAVISVSLQDTQMQDQTTSDHQEQPANLGFRLDSYKTTKEHGTDVKLVFHAIVEHSSTKHVGYKGIFLYIYTTDNHNTRELIQKGTKMNEQHFKYKGIGYTELKRSVSVPSDGSWKTAYYAYIVDSDEGKKPEYMKSKGREGRRFITNTEIETNGELHQYDGLLRFTHTTNIFMTYQDTMRSDATISARHFLVTIRRVKENQCIMTEHDLLTIESVMTSLIKVYRAVFKTEERDEFLNKVATKIFVSKSYNIFDDIKGEESLANQQKLLVHSAVMIFMHLKRYIKVSQPHQYILCEGLLPKLDQTNERCNYFTELKKMFPKRSLDIIDAVMNTITKLTESSACIEWIYCMPLIHFLTEKCVPGEKVPADVNYDISNPSWWGLSITETKSLHLEVIKGKCFDKSRLDTVIRKLEPYFAIDYLLPRTLMASIRLEQLSTVVKAVGIPSEVVFATICYSIMSTKTDKEITEKIGQGIRSCVFKIRDGYTVRSENLTNKESLVQLRLSYQIGEKLIKEMTSRADISVAQTIDAGSAVLTKMREYYAHVSGNVEEDFLSIFYLFQDNIVKSLQEKSSFHENEKGKLDQNLKNWNRTLNLDWLERNKILKEGLTTALDMRTHDNTLVQVYCKSNETFCDDVLDVLADFMFEVFQRLNTENMDYVNLKEDERKKFCVLLSKVLSKRLGHQQDQSDALNNALTWQFFSLYIQLDNGGKGKKGVICLSPDCNKKLELMIDLVRLSLLDLLTGKLKVKDLILIDKYQKNFHILVENMDEMKQYDFKKVISIRMKEFKAFKSFLHNINMFVILCSRFQGNISDLQEYAESLKGYQERTLDELCIPVDFLKQESDAEQPDIRVLPKYGPLYDLLEDIANLSEGYLFLSIWDKVGHSYRSKHDTCPLNAILSNIWPRAKEKWIKLQIKMRQGNLTFKKFEQKCGVEVENLANVLLPLENGNSCEWIDERIYQFELYKKLYTSVKSAEVLLDIQDTYKINGDFGALRAIVKLATEENMQMKDLKRSYSETCEILREFDDEKIECLKKFKDSKPLVDWLQEKMKGGLKELKVFIDLAFISAGEDPMEISKVSCFHSAVVGYEPLIFHIDQKSSYNDLLDRCKEIWKPLNTNPLIGQQLEDTCRQLEWVKIINELRGSVETTSLSQAAAINANGTYVIGNLTEKRNITHFTLSDVLELRFTEDRRGNEKENFFNIDNLQDLQSRLMLVASNTDKGKQDINRFLEILDGIKMLGKTYLRLLSSGCILFSSFQITFRCEADSNVCIFIKFGGKDDKQVIRGHRDKITADDSQILRTVAKWLETCHNQWNEFIQIKRDTNNVLNYFTMSQLVILQKELVKIGTKDTPSMLVYPILAVLNPNITQEDLSHACKQAKEDLKRLEMEEKTKIEGLGSLQTKAIAEEETLLQKLIDFDFNELLAREALKKFRLNQVNEAIVWCQKNEESLLRELEDSTTSWCKTNYSFDSIKAKLLEEAGGDIATGTETIMFNVIKKLNTLWDAFLKSASDSFVDFLSLSHAVLLLTRLQERKHTCYDIKRSIKECGFEEGQPNLLICPQSEIYSTALSIYHADNKTRLPEADEILLCSKETTLELVDIFLRRAFFENNSKIHCLLNADLLAYDISDSGEKILDKYMQRANQNGSRYQLVVICSSENEFNARLVTALEKFRKPPPPVRTDTHMKTYLENIFKTESSEYETSASHVDFESSSIRVVTSRRAGVGKSFYAKRMKSVLQNKPGFSSCNSMIIIPLYGRVIATDDVMDILLKQILEPESIQPRIVHIDISYEVMEGVDQFLFKLVILGQLEHSSGYVWRKSKNDYYIIEFMHALITEAAITTPTSNTRHSCLNLLPDVTCRSPEESINILSNIFPKDYRKSDLIFNADESRKHIFQRPYQYLKRFDKKEELYNVNLENVDGDKGRQCLKTLLRHCGITDPSWSELYHFVSFLNIQLEDFETSSFCGKEMSMLLPGFSTFVLKCIIQMSRDFSTKSLICNEESSNNKPLYKGSSKTENLEPEMFDYFFKRKWESSPHPYLLFNPDHHTMTFVGFKIDRENGNMIGDKGEIIEHNVMSTQLFRALAHQRVDLNENFNHLQRKEKLSKLRNAMGIIKEHDPDPTYELNTDNVKKILAVYMRFKADIPVVIMGETGCGKTRLVNFLCSLQQTIRCNREHKCNINSLENMIVMKIHGGTREVDIINKIKIAEDIAIKNATECPDMFTVLFFDEANTTDAIGTIKEIMCDKSLCGRPIKLHGNLKMVAACNPYKKHTEEVVRQLEQAGLGYHVHADVTSEKCGRLPMRRLVYRVHPLPPSMLQLVWDFGQLSNEVEEVYIKQMVKRYVKERKFDDCPVLTVVVSQLLSTCQQYLRQQKEECRFVSLRDVERTLEVTAWFLKQTTKHRLLYTGGKHNKMKDFTRSIMLALGVCYESCLKNKADFHKKIEGCIVYPLTKDVSLKDEMNRCQDLLLSKVVLPDNIAKNKALKENVFLMFVCIELRIPLFLVGKPGSSKSVAKTIINDEMQGATSSRNDLFRQYKQVQMVSFQCSPLSTPSGIIGTFNQCAEYQKSKDLKKFASVAVLDEIGLAEDSSKMSLKTLHFLLEEGCPCAGRPKKEGKVAFIGISNWALDPAKMNRGVFVQRAVPEKDELVDIASGICSISDPVIDTSIVALRKSLATSYISLIKQAETVKQREFFGLRDFYSLLKLVKIFTKQNRGLPTMQQLRYSILRNFGGLEGFDPVGIFETSLDVSVTNKKEMEIEPTTTTTGLIKACLGEVIETSEDSSRYLLLLTENYGDLDMLRQELPAGRNIEIIFGSSFPCDQEYTQVCRNINKIKVSMESGRTVILLNLETLYESLYEALNQYYVYYGGERFVDLGLGSHRVKCKVHRSFRLIVVAEKETVYKNFPIPLINRLEKHIWSLDTMLTVNQAKMCGELNEWVENFCTHTIASQHRRRGKRHAWDVVMGFHKDTCAAIIRSLCIDEEASDYETDKQKKETNAKEKILWCCTPDAVLRSSSANKKDIMKMYFQQQEHESLQQYMEKHLRSKTNLRVQVTTHSKLLSRPDVDTLCAALSVEREYVKVLSLHSYETEQQFCNCISDSFIKTKESKFKILIVQCENGDTNADLIACARYSIQIESSRNRDDFNTCVFVIVQLPRVTRQIFTGFQCGTWSSVHLDDLRPLPDEIPSLSNMYLKPISELLPPIQESAIPSKAGTTLDIITMIFDCIQPALALIKDFDEDISRTTERIKLIFSMKENTMKDKKEGRNSFIGGIAIHLINLFKEKEEKLHDQKEWLSVEAASPEQINKAGTFRRSVIQCLHDKITRLLAGIIAFVDKNRNMNILAKNKSENWKTRLWLHIINTPTITAITCTDLLNQQRRSTLSNFVVEGTSREGAPFDSRMPFSWLMFELVEILWNFETDDLHHKGSDTTDEVIKRFQNKPLGRILLNPEDIDDATKCYISDFVHMAYTVRSTSEHTVVCEEIFEEYKRIKDKVKEDHQLISVMVSCHALFVSKGIRFRHFSEITNVWPECGDKTLAFYSKDADIRKNEMQTLDLVGLKLLLDNLNPKREEISSSAGRTEWMLKICQYRPVIERILAYYSGRNNIDLLQESRCQWTKAMVMKLFIEIVCIDELGVKLCMRLWHLLGDKTDMKKKESLECVEDFLKSKNEDVCKTLFGRDECNNCKEKHKMKPTSFPCRHTVCKQCYKESLRQSNVQCPICSETFPRTFDEQTFNESENIQKYNDFVQKCNLFFMEIVTQLCFAGGTPPNEDVVKKLLSYITVETKKGWIYSKHLEIFEDSIDRTPVVRSFLLQLLMTKSGGMVNNHLQDYFAKVMSLVYNKEGSNTQIGNDKIKHLANTKPNFDEVTTTPVVEVCLLVLHCMEDLFYQSFPQHNNAQIAKAKDIACERIDLDVKNKILENIQSISKTRFAMSVTATCIYNIYIKKTAEQDVHHQLFVAIEIFIKNCTSKWPRKFFIKYFCRRFGTDNYKTVRSSSDTIIQTLTNDSDHTMKEVDKCQDRFVLCGTDYLSFRSNIYQFHLDRNMEPILKLLQINTQRWRTEALFCLAIYRECTLMFVSKTKNPLYPSKIRESLVNTVAVAQQDLMKRLLTNTLWKSSQLNLSFQTEPQQQGLICLLTHFYVLVNALPKETNVFSPFKNLSLHPEQMVKCYLPTMPQDDLDQIRPALEERFNRLKLYFCPNNHPYVVSECGVPVVTARCKTCRKKIGGNSHKLLRDNTEDTGKDRTRPGHILGIVEHDKASSPRPIRSLNSSSCCVIRLMVHLSMLIGSQSSTGDVVCKMIQPIICETEVTQFLLEHVKNDIAAISQLLAKSEEDIITLTHVLLVNIMDSSKMIHSDRTISQSMCYLKDKIARAEWEERFNRDFIVDWIERADYKLKVADQNLHKEHPSDPLLKLLYEPEKPDIDTSLSENPVLWQYRDCITLEHLLQTSEVISEKFPVLHLFLQKDFCLRILCYLPSIIRLQRMLLEKYNGKIDRKDASKKKVEIVRQELKRDPKYADFDICFNDFTSAWRSVRRFLHGYSIPRNGVVIQLKPEYCQKQIDDETPLSYLLPNTTDAGLCGFAMVYYLLEQQSLFLKEYCSIYKQIEYETLHRVLVKNISSAHLITYDPDFDLLPLILANCNYTFEEGQEIQISYNYSNIEHQLIDRFIFTKSVPNLSSIEMMTYKSEITNGTVFRSLRDKLNQESISPTVLSQIRKELQAGSFSDICGNITTLDTAIKFMISVGGQPDESLSNFISHTLQIEPGFVSKKAQMFSQCKHVQSLWITLSLEKNKRLRNAEEESFTSVTPSLKKELAVAQKNFLQDIWKRLQLTQLYMLLEILFECIILTIDIPKQDEESFDMSTLSLEEAVSMHLNLEFPYENECNIPKWIQSELNKLEIEGDDPRPLLGSHSVETWNFVYGMFMQKNQDS